jgi:hypothetical protein
MDKNEITNCPRCNLIYPVYIIDQVGGCPRCLSRDQAELKREQEIQKIRNEFPPNKTITIGLDIKNNILMLGTALISGSILGYIFCILIEKFLL